MEDTEFLFSNHLVNGAYGRGQCTFACGVPGRLDGMIPLGFALASTPYILADTKKIHRC